MNRTISVDQVKFDRYGRINGDNDILHYDHDYAVKRGFRGTLAHGLMVLGYAVNLAAEKYGRDFFYEGEVDARFISPVFPGDDVTVFVEDDSTLLVKTQHAEVMKGRIGLRQ